MIIKNKQYGLVLITSLILIFVLALAVSSNIGGILIDEKIIANQKDHFIALEAAEAALREAENKLINQQVEPTNTLEDGTKVLPNGAAENENDTEAWCLVRNDDWWQIEANISSFTGASSPPQYIIEDLEYVQDSLVRGQQRDKVGRNFYRITAKGSGGTSTAKVILQTTFTKRY